MLNGGKIVMNPGQQPSFAIIVTHWFNLVIVLWPKLWFSFFFFKLLHVVNLDNSDLFFKFCQ